MPIWIRNGGSYKQPVSVHVRDGGAWKQVVQAWIRDNGIWKLAYVAAEWVEAVLQPPVINSRNAILRLQATYGEGLTFRVEIRYDEGNGYTEYQDVTALLTPAAGEPPTSATSYTFITPYQHVFVSEDVVTAQARVTILAEDVVVDQIETTPVDWEHSGIA